MCTTYYLEDSRALRGIAQAAAHHRLRERISSKLVGGKMILPPHGKEFFHSTVSSFLHPAVSTFLHVR